MNEIEKLIKFLPPIKALDISDISESVTYIGSVGFEDRALSFLKKAQKERKKIEQVILIEYKPYDKRNRKKEFKKILDALQIPKDNVKWVVYDRYKPQEFSDKLDLIIDTINMTSDVVIDISAMSKLLIIALLHGIRYLNRAVNIIYAEAKIYHPTQNKFKAQKEKFEKETDNLPIFLTSDVYDIVTTTSLSTTVMQGYPLMIVAFPTFNHRELTALVNENTPQHLILLEGKPHKSHNNWRLEAIMWLNRRIIEHIGNGNSLSKKERTISTFDFTDTIRVLERIYQLYKYDRKIVVVPTGSKLQTFGVFLFKQMHPDIQIIYPVTKTFSDLYTNGTKDIWQISIKNFLDFISQLDSYRTQGLDKLKIAIQDSI